MCHVALDGSHPFTFGNSKAGATEIRGSNVGTIITPTLASFNLTAAPSEHASSSA
jgi:hypothetical protein